VCIGDFNEALSNEEHLGPTRRGETQMHQFRECLEGCHLVDLGFSGPNIPGTTYNMEIKISVSGWTELSLMATLHTFLMIHVLKIL
jgi:hypothetical protein